MFNSDPFPNTCLICWKPIIDRAKLHVYSSRKNWDAGSDKAWLLSRQIESKVKGVFGKWNRWAEFQYRKLDTFVYGVKGSWEAKELEERMRILFEIYFEIPRKGGTIRRARDVRRAAVVEEDRRARPIEEPRRNAQQVPIQRFQRTTPATWENRLASLKGELGLVTIVLLSIILFSPVDLDSLQEQLMKRLISFDYNVACCCYYCTLTGLMIIKAKTLSISSTKRFMIAVSLLVLPVALYSPLRLLTGMAMGTSAVAYGVYDIVTATAEAGLSRLKSLKTLLVKAYWMVISWLETILRIFVLVVLLFLVWKIADISSSGSLMQNSEVSKRKR